jgi:sec-independent protein translocase protein TatB
MSYAESVFGNLGWLEIGMLLVVALLVFGPDKLPSVARDAARMLRELRRMAQGARTQLKSELGPEFADFDFDSLNPRAFVRKHLLEDDDTFEEPARRPGAEPRTERTTAAGEPGSDGERTPFDPDTT